MSHKFLVHKHGDHVGIAVADIEHGEHVKGVYMDDGSTIEVDARNAIPFGHKIAIADLDAGSTVTEYGTAIGKTHEGFLSGAYVHTHNLRSSRW